MSKCCRQPTPHITHFSNLLLTCCFSFSCFQCRDLYFHCLHYFKDTLTPNTSFAFSLQTIMPLLFFPFSFLADNNNYSCWLKAECFHGSRGGHLFFLKVLSTERVFSWWFLSSKKRRATKVQGFTRFTVFGSGF